MWWGRATWTEKDVQPEYLDSPLPPVSRKTCNKSGTKEDTHTHKDNGVVVVGGLKEKKKALMFYMTFICVRPLCCVAGLFLGVFHYSSLLFRSSFFFFLIFWYFDFSPRPEFFGGYYTIFVWSFSPLRFISAQTMRERDIVVPPFRILFLGCWAKKEKKNCPYSYSILVLPFLLPLRWRPTCRSERVSDRTIKLKEDKK